MQLPIITGLYAGLLGIFLCVLTAQVGILRGKLGISLYDGGDKQLGLTIRRQANLTEQAPMALIVIALVEVGGAPIWAIHALGGVLLVARLIHPFGLDPDKHATPIRAVSALATTVVIVVASAWVIYRFFVAPSAT